jgi:hypothetical protein
MKTDKNKINDNASKPYNIVVPFNIPGKPDIGLLDLNKIFQVNLNYNFDSLKLLLEGLINSYKNTQEELENIRAYNKVKDMKIKDLEQKMLDLNILLNNTVGNAEEAEKLKDLKDKLINQVEEEPIPIKTHVNVNKEVKEISYQTQNPSQSHSLETDKLNSSSQPQSLKKQSAIKYTKKRKKIHAPINKDIKLDIQLGNDDIINKIIKKVNGYELCLNDLYEAVPQMQKETDNNLDIFKNFEDELIEMDSKINSLLEENISIKKKFEETEENFKEINIKLQDLNIIDILKGNTTEGGDTNITLNLISNLEKKINARNKLLEEKISKIDSSCFKIEKEGQNIKNSQNLNKRQIDQIKSQIEELNSREENFNRTIEQNNDDLLDKIDSKVAYLEKYTKDSLNNLTNNFKQKFSTISENITFDKGSSKDVMNSIEFQNLNSENINAIKHLKEAMVEMNKKIKAILNQNDFEQIKADISALKSGMSNYVLIPDFKELKELSEENKKTISKIREEFEDFVNAQAENSEIINIKRKLESVSNKVHDIIENVINKKGDNNNSRSNANDKYKFIEFKIFEEFKSHIAKEFNNINDNFINSRKLLDELIDSVRNRTSYKDLKALEDAMLSKMEDLKITFAKKFADKNEMNRVIKYLDQQIKNIIQIYIKKIEKGDNWLLAKKPITNNLCASCESYIGDIKDSNNNNIYIPWNKYPVKDPNDKLYRMGSGYSKMLQMIQIDENEKKMNSNRMTKTELFSGLDMPDFSGKKNNTISSMNKTLQKSLPKLKRKKVKKKINTTDTENNNININDESDDGEDDPKITKIFRVNKEQH